MVKANKKMNLGYNRYTVKVCVSNCTDPDSINPCYHMVLLASPGTVLEALSPASVPENPLHYEGLSNTTSSGPGIELLRLTGGPLVGPSQYQIEGFSYPPFPSKKYKKEGGKATKN